MYMGSLPLPVENLAFELMVFSNGELENYGLTEFYGREQQMATLNGIVNIPSWL